MKINDLAESCGFDAVVIGENREVKGFYCGDLLSIALIKAKADCLWFTVMNNINVAAVASTVGVAGLVLCCSSRADDALKAKAKELSISIHTTDMDVFSAATTANSIFSSQNAKKV